MASTDHPEARDVAWSEGLPEPRALTRLKRGLADLPSGDLHSRDVALLLEGAWSYLYGASAGEMSRERLASCVLSDLRWAAPVLSFKATQPIDASNGARASVWSQSWQVDVQDGVAWIVGGCPLDLPTKVDAAALARELVEQVVAGRWSRAIVAKAGGRISIRPGDVEGLDVGFARTLPGRHQRFRVVLDHAMAHAGFERLGPYRFRKKGPGGA
jgi:hypothetical protein